MDETSLRDLLERATASEPPIGPIARNALAAGLKIRRRRRLQATVGGVSAAAVAVAVVVTAVSGTPAQTNRALDKMAARVRHRRPLRHLRTAGPA